MLYVGIDQHKAQITINLRNERGNVIQQGQVSTDHAKVDDFFAALKKQSARTKGFMAIIEVCGFNNWLIKKLNDYGCKEIVLMQPDKTSNKKTDRRDANALCELLWNNRKRLQNGERPNGIRRVVLPKPEENAVRQASHLRQHLVRQRTKCINKIRSVLRKHNMEQDCPSKQYKTKKVKQWLKTLELQEQIDRMEIDVHLKIWETLDEQIIKLEHELLKQAETNKNVMLLVSMPGITAMGAITLLSRIGSIERFKTPDSLANYFGLTPGCRNSGETNRPGSITKAGSQIARQVLNFAVIHAVRKDKAMRDWHKAIKKRRGSKIARVAVMRKLATIIWHILKRQTMFQFRFDPMTNKPTVKSKKKTTSGFLRHGNNAVRVVKNKITKTPSSPKRQTKAKSP